MIIKVFLNSCVEKICVNLLMGVLKCFRTFWGISLRGFAKHPFTSGLTFLADSGRVEIFFTFKMEK